MRIHGESRTSFYYKYRSMLRRCNYKKDKDYKRYGARGIKLLWLYEEFKKDMYKSYLRHVKKYGKNNTSLDRIDNDGNYCKENCRWATMNKQARNKRVNRYITYKGKTMIVADWARKLGISRQSVRYRLEKGWDIKNLITIPFNYHNKYDKDKKIVRTPKKLFTEKSE